MVFFHVSSIIFCCARGVIRFVIRVQMRLAFDDQLKAGPVYLQVSPNQQNFQSNIQTCSGLHTGFEVSAGLGEQPSTSTQCSNNPQLQILPSPIQPYVDLGVNLGTPQVGRNLRNRVEPNH